MIKQGVVQEKISDLTSMNQLPPLGTLPQWSRVNTLNRGGYPKPFVKDKLQPIVDKSVGDDEERMMDLSELNPSQRIQYLERSIIFLKQQHSEVLRSLHEEIEGLKKENKDLQFKLIMSQREQQQQHQNSASSRHSRNGKEIRGLEKESSSLSIQSGYYYLSKTLESSSRGLSNKSTAQAEGAPKVPDGAHNMHKDSSKAPDSAQKQKSSALKEKDGALKDGAPQLLDSAVGGLDGVKKVGDSVKLDTPSIVIETPEKDTPGGLIDKAQKGAHGIMFEF